MYVYFDANGTLKEIISDKSFRVGDSKKDKIYVYWDGEHAPFSGWVKYRKPNGREYPESVEECFFQFGDNLVGKELPNKPLRNLKYFSYDHTYEENGETHVGYKFYEITIPDEILNSSMDDEKIPSENNMVVARIRFVMDDNKNGKVDEADSIETLGALVFSVETNIGILTDSSINETQYNYLIQLVSMKLGTNTKSVKVSQLPSTGIAGTIYYVKNTESDLIYDAYFWNGSNFVYLGTTSYGLYTEQEGDYFETAIQTLWTAEMNDYEALINGEFETYKSSLNSQMIAWGNLIQAAASGSPKGVYPTLSALQNAFPTGTNGIYVVSENGHWYYWNGSAWSDGGVYQNSEDINQIKEDLNEIQGIIYKTIEKDLGWSFIGVNNNAQTPNATGWGHDIHTDNYISKIVTRAKTDASDTIVCSIMSADMSTELAKAEAVAPVGNTQLIVFDFGNYNVKGDLVVLFKTKNGAKLSYCYKANYTANTFLRKNSNNTYNWYHPTKTGWGIWIDQNQGFVFDLYVKELVSTINKMNYLYVATNGNDISGDGSFGNPFATIYHANEVITDNSKENQYTIIVKNGTYTDLQTRYSGVIWQTGDGYQGVVCKDYVHYQSENPLRPDLCKIIWDGVTGLQNSDRTNNNTSPKCAFHIAKNTHTSIKGFYIEAKNTRYCMHIETTDSTIPCEWLIENCILKWNGTPDLIDVSGIRPVIGMGTTLGEVGVVKNCKLINNDNSSNRNPWIVQTHDNSNNPSMSIKVGCKYTFENCITEMNFGVPTFELRDGSTSYDVGNILNVINCVNQSNDKFNVTGTNSHWKTNFVCTTKYNS